jgi:hypothetical protein
LLLALAALGAVWAWRHGLGALLTLEALQAAHASLLAQVEARPLLGRQVVLVAAAGLRGTATREHYRGKRGHQEPQRRDAQHVHRQDRGTMQEARIVQSPAPGCGFPRISAGFAT